jgi:hypothetical protein
MTLRSRIISLHADGKSSGKLHMVSLSQSPEHQGAMCTVQYIYVNHWYSPDQKFLPGLGLLHRNARCTLGETYSRADRG